jgi:hypothetical protein
MMALIAHLTELERKHRALEAEIASALDHPSTDALELVELKRKKLRLKEQIERLREDTLH